MIKKVLVLAFAILLLQGVFAAPLEVEKVEKSNVLISELNDPAVFDFLVNNSDGMQSIRIYSFVGIDFDPENVEGVENGQNIIQVKVYPREDLRERTGYYNFEYEIKGSVSGITKDTLTIKFVGVKDLLEIKSGDIEVGSDRVNIAVRNVQNINLDNVVVHFTSSFFDQEKTISLKPFESMNLSLNIDENSVKSISSGSYVFNSEVRVGNASAEMESTLNYLPREESSLEKDSSGFIIRKTTYTRVNTGNVPTTAKIEVSRDVLSRLFTINSVEPLEVERSALSVTYVWEKSLQPNESYSVSTTTNYTFPFILILLVVIVALLVRLYTRTTLVIDKRVSFVKTRGGEFALKVRLHVKAKKYIENVQIIDRLPAMTQLYEKFGIMPDKIDAASKRLFWNVDRLNSGEERVYSYIIYSKVQVVGRFELPSATATYLRDGKTEQVFSNRTFFVAETGRTDVY